MSCLQVDRGQHQAAVSGNSVDFNVYVEPCNTVAMYVESYHDKGYYLRKDLAEINGLIEPL